jgi:hypothetical protein
MPCPIGICYGRGLPYDRGMRSTIEMLPGNSAKALESLA